jgi:predicted FMN-binding regulatory protein PaiB
MYLPKAFQESDAEVLASFVRARPLATFVSLDASGFILLSIYCISMAQI